MPFTLASSGSSMTERILVPNTYTPLARANTEPRSVIGFITFTPFTSGSNPLSTFTNGATRFTSQS